MNLSKSTLQRIGGVVLRAATKTAALMIETAIFPTTLQFTVKKLIGNGLIGHPQFLDSCIQVANEIYSLILATFVKTFDASKIHLVTLTLDE